MAVLPLYLSAPGLVCCAGKDREDFFHAALAGDQSGIVPSILPGDFRFFWGCVPDEWIPLAVPAVKEEAGFTEDTRLLRICAAALKQIRPDVERAVEQYGPYRVGVCVGSCDNGSEWSLEAHRTYFTEGRFPPSYKLVFQSASYPAGYAARYFGLSGPSLGVATACASSAGAIVKAAELIRAGLCDAVVVGGVDIASEAALRGFASLEAVSDEVCNPFSRNRKGITLGEGAAFFVLSPDRGRGIELLGAGESADAHHMTAPRPDGAGAVRAMEEALDNAGIKPADVGYVNLHGTGTSLNDRMEAQAMAAVFGAGVPRRPGSLEPLVSSTKPVTGHTLGAAGALELALCWMTVANANTGTAASVPVHCWDGEYDMELPRLRFAGKGEAVPAEQLQICMSNSFAFGGCNTSLIIGKKPQKG
ncbi:MAG: 3-oxoacyl-ACP synthase [Treponema sp.]|jgi:3-oxoacyl-[acyl-carrier-protein] synthase-1|nr:3-oxoacyl-ACP synthase [Treponema sp.]